MNFLGVCYMESESGLRGDDDDDSFSSIILLEGLFLARTPLVEGRRLHGLVGFEFSILDDPLAPRARFVEYGISGSGFWRLSS